MELQRCPECGAVYQEGSSCQEHFHQMLYWENDFPNYGKVHHLMVVCYHLQHPGLLSPEGLDGMKELLLDFLEHGLGPEEVRRRTRLNLNSAKRTWKINATSSRKGNYQRPISWTTNVADVTACGTSEYIRSILSWAETILLDLRSSGNI